MISLFEHYPLLKQRIPYTPLGEFPTPIEKLSQLGQEIGTDQLYIKQDGLGGTFYGGNKIRKLEFLLGDALGRQAREVITFGYAGSNHALATAIYAQKLGLGCISMLLPQPNAQYVRRNLLLSHLCGAELHQPRNVTAVAVRTVLQILWRRLRRGRAPYVISPGGSSPLGTVGYVSAGFELREQVEAGSMVEPDEIFVALGTMGTAVGLTLGLAAAGLKTRVVAVRVVDIKYANSKKFVELFDATRDLVRSLDPSFPRVSVSEKDIDIRHGFFGEQYAQFTERGMAAVELAASSQGVRLEGTYTGKTMAALADHVRRQSAPDTVILFWDTHNARDFSDAIKEVDYHHLPASFHRYFEQDVQPLDEHHS